MTQEVVLKLTMTDLMEMIEPALVASGFTLIDWAVNRADPYAIYNRCSNGARTEGSRAQIEIRATKNVSNTTTDVAKLVAEGTRNISLKL
jgi:hypothetical protein